MAPDERRPFHRYHLGLPVLAKYAWNRPAWKPIIEAGPSFRFSGNLNAYRPSHHGAAIGAGLAKDNPYIHPRSPSAANAIQVLFRIATWCDIRRPGVPRKSPEQFRPRNNGLPRGV